MSVSAPNDEPITLPQQPVRSPPSPFPVLAALAPVAVSVLIWLVTGSSFALMFAALGPVIAIASVIDSRWSSGRRLKKDRAAYAAELDSISQLIDSRLDEERQVRRRNAPGARALVGTTGMGSTAAPSRRPHESGEPDVARSVRLGRWRVSGAARTRVVVGTGTLPSTLRVDGAVDSAAGRALRDRARFASGVPVGIDATRGIGVVGATLPARGFARGILLQLCNAMGPETAEVLTEGPGWDWVSVMPHAGTGRGAPVTVVVRDLTAAPGSPDLLPERNPRSLAGGRSHDHAGSGSAWPDHVWSGSATATARANVRRS